jgi:SH3-like domain-containing protein
MSRRSRTIAIVSVLGLGLGALLLIPGENAATVASVDTAATAFDPARPQDKLAVLLGQKLPPLPPPRQETEDTGPIRVATAAPAPQQAAAQPVAAPDFSGLRLNHVGAAALNLRAAPSGSAARVAVLSPGQPVHVGAATGGWVEVTLDDGRTGFVSARYLASAAPAVATTAAATPEPPAARAVVQGAPDDNALAGRTARVAASLPVRAQPRGSASRVLTLDPGTRVRILDVRGRWLRIETAEGVSGWIERAG